LEILSYTTRDNGRSQAVMRRIGLVREASRDFADQNGQEYIVFRANRSWLSRRS